MMETRQPKMVDRVFLFATNGTAFALCIIRAMTSHSQLEASRSRLVPIR